MLGTVERLDYDGKRVLKVVLRFPSTRMDSSEETVKEITTCERVGQGSFGTVYRALCDGYPNLALKIATGKSTRLKQELDVLSKTCTRGKLLLPRFEFGALNKSGDLIVVGMELCVPRTMHDFLISAKLTGEADKLFIAYQATQAVSYVHEAGCIHRDIKLQNFVFDLHGNVKLIDFGLACNSLKPPAGDVVAGTVSFMAPEMAHNALHKDRRVSVGAPGDVWSLGIVLFSIFTQRNPYPTSQGDSDDSDDSDGGESRNGEAEEAEAEAEAEEEHGDNGDSSNAAVLVKSAANSPASQSTRQRLTNERLLKRVAAGEWRWPAQCSVSAELKGLVESILVKDPAKRPTVQSILQCKTWHLRRRAPPQTLEQFLGVQDDFLLSRDEAHLMRAVEERSNQVVASLRTSRAHSMNAADSDKENNGVSQGGEELEGGCEGRAATPVRPEGSLRVVTKDGCEVGGMPTVQVYDVRASARKHSKSLRAISEVIAEETAKKGGSAAPSAPRSGAARSRSRNGSSSAVTSRVNSRAGSLGSNKARGKRVAASRATSAVSQAGSEDHRDAPDNLFDSVLPHDVSTASVAASTSDAIPNASTGAAALPSSSGVFPVVKAAAVRHAGSAVTCSTASSGRPLFESRSDTDAEYPATATTAAANTGARRAHSISLLCEDGDAHDGLIGDETRSEGRKDDSRRPSAKTRSRDPSLRQRSSSLLADLMPHNGFVSSVSRPRSVLGSKSATPRSRVGSAQPPLPQRVGPAPPPPPLVDASSSQSLQAPRRRRVPAAFESKAAATLSVTVALLESDDEVVDVDVHTGDEGEDDAEPVEEIKQLPILVAKLLREEEAAGRSLLAATLLVEHEWLLASFRLTIEEDQERYGIVWLAAEQAKSASHPHKFKEVAQIPNRRYQYGFVCDFCDYEFLPTGRSRKELHFFHCTCGRDLCPECFEAYQQRCTCAGCGVVHLNSCHLRDHVCLTRGRGAAAGSGSGGGSDRRAPASSSRRGRETAVSLTKGKNGASAASGGGGRGGRRRRRRSEESEEDLAETVGDAAVDEGPTHFPLPRALARGRRAARSESASVSRGAKHSGAGGTADRTKGSMHMSIAAMHQSKTGGAEGVLDSSSKRQRLPSAGRIEARTDTLPEGPWQPFTKLRREVVLPSASLPTPEEREVMLNGEWVRYFYLYPDNNAADVMRLPSEEGPFAFVYHIQPGRTGAVFLSSEFPMHSAIFSLMERQFFIVDQVNTFADSDVTRVTTLVKAKSTLGLSTAYHALQEIVSYDTNLLKQHRSPGTVSVYQAPRSAYGSHGGAYVFVRWFRFNEDRSLSAFLLSNGAVQVFVNNEFELRWFDESRKFLVRHNGVCEVVGDSTFTLAPAINQLLYGSFDT